MLSIIVCPVSILQWCMLHKKCRPIRGEVCCMLSASLKRRSRALNGGEVRTILKVSPHDEMKEHRWNQDDPPLHRCNMNHNLSLFGSRSNQNNRSINALTDWTKLTHILRTEREMRRVQSPRPTQTSFRRLTKVAPSSSSRPNSSHLTEVDLDQESKFIQNG